MKYFYFLLILITAQISAAQDTITIDFTKSILVQEQLVSRGEHIIEFTPETGSNYLIKMSKETNLLGSLSIPDPEGEAFYLDDQEETIYQTTLKFKDNTKYSFEVEITDSEGNNETITFIIKSQSDFSWATTIGFNAIFLGDNDLYRSIESAGAFSIMQDSGQKKMDLVPSVMFTYAKFGNDFTVGPTAGIGFDLEKISVFAGASLGIGQNFILTAGVALHQQDKLDAQYEPGQIVPASLSFDDLHEDYYRFNPFVSLALRLDKNPFSK